MPEAVIVDAVRTPIGRAVKGSLKDMRADDLAAVPLRALIERNPAVDFAETDDVMMGAARGDGDQGYNVGRNAALLAGIDHHVPACTLNRFCASSLQTIRMAFHAIKAGEGEQYVAAGVESVSHAGGGAPVPYHPKLDGSDGSLYDVYIPMGMTAENVARALPGQPRGPGRVGGRLAGPRGRRAGERALRPRDRPGRRARGRDDDGNVTAEARTVTKDDGPRPGTTMEVLGEPQARVPRGRVGHRRQLVPAQRRRRRRARDVRGPGGEPGPRAAGADRRLDRRRDPAGDHGPRPDPRDPRAARADRDDDRRRRHRRDQRGVRGAGRAVPRRARDPGGQAQPVRRRDRPRPSVRHDRRADHDHAPQRPRRASTAATGSSRCASRAAWARRCSSSG